MNGELGLCNLVCSDGYEDCKHEQRPGSLVESQLTTGGRMVDIVKLPKVARSSYGDGWETRVESLRGDAIIGSP